MLARIEREGTAFHASCHYVLDLLHLSVHRWVVSPQALGDVLGGAHRVFLHQQMTCSEPAEVQQVFCEAKIGG